MTLVRVRLYVSLKVFILVQQGMAGWGSELFVSMEEERGTNHDERRTTNDERRAHMPRGWMIRYDIERERRCGVSEFPIDDKEYDAGSRETLSAIHSLIHSFIHSFIHSCL
jgi:hypothetical protein